jgi:hypothetical protein
MPISGNRPPDMGPSIEESLRDAESRSLDFPAMERAVYVRAMATRVGELRNMNRSVDEIKALLPEFARDYPHLFETLTGADYDPSTLQSMLALLERMGNGSLNHHQATVIVGKRLAQKYIRPDGSASASSK